MRAGTLRHRGTIQKEEQVQGPGGVMTPTWVNVADVWVGISPLSGSEQLRGQQLQARVTHRIRMRWRAGVKPSWRLSLSGRTFTFQTVITKDEKQAEMEILAEEKVV